MPQYDPQRSRSRQRKADDEGPAPVDALLGPDPTAPAPAVPAPAVPAPATDPGLAASADASSSATSVPSSPSLAATIAEPPVDMDVAHRTAKPVAVAAVGAAALVVVWWVLRRRRRGRVGSGADRG